MRKSIVFKLFVINSIVFTAFLGLILIFQTIFFEKFYIESKKTQLANQLDGFLASYQKEAWDAEQVVKSINRFVEDNNAQLAVLDENGIVKFTNSYAIILEDENKNKITIPLNNIAYTEALWDLKLSTGDTIVAEGLFTGPDRSSLVPSSIQKDEKKWTSVNQNLFASSGSIQIRQSTENNLFFNSSDDVNITLDSLDKNMQILSPQNVLTFTTEKVAGKILELRIPSKPENLTSYSMNALLNVADNWFWMQQAGNAAPAYDKIYSYDYVNQADGSKRIVFAKSLLKQDGSKETVLATSSLQPVGEAIDVMKNYYVYAFLIALVIIMLLSIIYSKTVSKPLIKLNKAAARMADLDFSEKYDLKSDDEIGSLAASLTKLSESLSTSLEELKAANRQLINDIEKEKALESMRKEFVSSVSHELKTPLGIIKAFAEGLKDGISEKKKDHYLSVILNEGEKMNLLILDMLDLAKLESGTYNLHKDYFDLVDMLKQNISRLSSLLEKKDIKVIYEIDQEEAQVFADQERIDQVIVNLLNNAARHTEQKGSITIGLKHQGGKLHLSIENSGSHIPEAKLIRIWDRFYRVEESRDRYSGGTGLGLSIVKNILELHHFGYGAENTESGVKFYVIFNCIA